MDVQPVILKGNFVRLEPLSADHIESLGRFCFDELIWRWYPYSIRNIEDMHCYVNEALANQKVGRDLPFVIVEIASNAVVGCTRFMNLDAGNRRVEIGSTWLDPKWQRTYVNTEAKIQLLSHAFEVWNCIRVEFKTDAMNRSSRDAIARLGAKEEGTFRQHMVTESGRLRDSVYFSILDTEWTDIKTSLMAKLKKYPNTNS